MKISFREWPWPAQVVFFCALAAALVGIVEYLPGSMTLAGRRKELANARNRANQLRQQVSALKDFERRHARLKADLAESQKKLAALEQIVPANKDLDQFMRQVQQAATLSGVTVRRLLAKPVVQHEYHNEMPFEVELDGPYFGIDNFFERLAVTPRIMNIKDLVMTGLGEAPKYKTTAGSTATVTFTVVAFYSHNAEPSSAAKR